MVSQVNIPAGVSDFVKLRKTGCYYVDKTASVSTLVRDMSESILFTRPRRFGKTTFQQMLRAFFDIREYNRDIFEGLAIMDDKEAVDNWMNKYPVIHLSFKSVEGDSFDDAFNALVDAVYPIFQGYRFIQPEAEEEANRFKEICKGRISASEMRRSLFLLAKLLYEHYGKRVIILIDEYDVPLSKAEQNGYYNQMLDIIRAMLLSVLKDCPYTERSILTGCLRLSKESMFTGLNNLVVHSATGKKYADTFGFSEDEVAKLLMDTGFEDKAGIVKEWYDGYNIGGISLYTPWDVLSYIVDLQVDRNSGPMNYWTNASGNEAVRGLIDATDADVGEEYSALLSGGVIRKRIIETLTYRNLYSSSENIWSLLFMTGYLTLAGPYQPNGETELRIPNEEIRELFSSCVDTWFQETVTKSDRKPLFDALWSGDAEKLSEIISQFLFETISYLDYKEDYYHAFLAGLLSGDGCTVSSNKETGTGRADIIVKDKNKKRRRVAVIEVKRSSSHGNMEKDAQKALAQIEKRQYGQDFTDYTTVLKYGAAFFSKSVIIKSAE